MDYLEYYKLYYKIKYGLLFPRTRIVKGITGATGPTGPTGATGSIVGDVFVKKTQTLDPQYNANVIVDKQDDDIFFEFFIPRGATGISEKIQVGNVESVDANVGAKIIDRYEQDKHYMDFQIPIGVTGPKGEQGLRGEKGATGETGPKGDKGVTGEQGPRGFPGEIGISEVITIDGTNTVPYGEDASVQDDFDRNIHHLTFYIPQGKTGERGDKGETGSVGPKGEQGETGPQGIQGPIGKTGPAGPPGATPNINITKFNSSSQEIRNKTPIVLNATLVNNSMTSDDSSIIIPSNGVYLISFSINNGAYATSGDCVGVAVNLNLIDASRRPLTASTNTSCTFVQKLAKGDYVSLLPTLSSSTTLLASGAPSAMLTVVLLAY